MKTHPFALLLFLLLGSFTCCMATTGTPEGPSEISAAGVLNIMEQVCDWQIAHPSNWPAAGWHQGAFYTGVMALAQISNSPRFHDAMMQMGETNHWQLEKRIYHADDHCVGQTYAELYMRHHDPKMIAPLRERFDYILAHPQDDNLEFVGKEKNFRWAWSDSLFMGPPTWLRLYVVTGEKKYLDFMVEHWWKTSDYLYDQEEHLYFRDSTYFERREANGEKIFWGRGNGWVMAGLVRLLQYLPADHPSRPRFVRQFQEMAAKVAACQQPDGLWRASLLDPASYTTKETSSSGFFAYALAYGVNEGLLDRATYEPVVRTTWRALVGCVNADGKLTHVQPVGANPEKNFDENSTEVFGVGAFLLAGSEVYRLVGGTQPEVSPATPSQPNRTGK